MARRPTRKAAGKSARAAPPAATTAPTPASERDKIIAALLALLGDNPLETIGLADVAAQAGVSLAQLRGEFGSTFAIIAAHIKATDRAVLAADLSDMAEEPARERLFDVLMRRLENFWHRIGKRCAHCCARPAAIPRSRWRSIGMRCARSNGC